jgi:flagellar biosynthesis protein FlhB
MSSDRKTEEPTPRRLRKARLDGDHPTSPLLVGFGALGGSLAVAPFALEALVRNTREGLIQATRVAVAPDPTGLVLQVGSLVAAPLVAAAMGALVFGIAQTGGTLGTKQFALNFGRLSPIGRNGPSFGARLLSLWIGLCAGIGICFAAWLSLSGDGARLVASVGDGRASLELAARACRSLAGWALAVLLLAAVADGVVRYRAWLNRHRMSRDEVRQEQRENGGDPALRRARERIHRELSSGASLREMANASLLVFGAPRWAVALRYDTARDNAPRVVLRAVGARATELHALAISHSVPIEHDTTLARALANVPLDEEVPQKLYAEVAQALRRAGLFRPGS